MNQLNRKLLKCNMKKGRNGIGDNQEHPVEILSTGFSNYNKII